MTVILVEGPCSPNLVEGILAAAHEVTSWRVLVALTRRCARVLGNEDIQVLGDDVQNVRD